MNIDFDQRKRFEEMFLEYLNTLYNFALRLTGSQVDAEDLVQETFLSAFRSSSKFKKGTNARSWLFKVMYNIFINQRKRKKREYEILELEKERLLNQEISQDLSNKSLSSDLQEALNALPEEFRTVVVLCDREGFSYRDISKIVGCPVGTVRSRLFRARKLLCKKLFNYVRTHK